MSETGAKSVGIGQSLCTAGCAPVCTEALACEQLSGWILAASSQVCSRCETVIVKHLLYRTGGL